MRGDTRRYDPRPDVARLRPLSGSLPPFPSVSDSPTRCSFRSLRRAGAENAEGERTPDVARLIAGHAALRDNFEISPHLRTFVRNATRRAHPRQDAITPTEYRISGRSPRFGRENRYRSPLDGASHSPRRERKGKLGVTSRKCRLAPLDPIEIRSEPAAREMPSEIKFPNSRMRAR